MQDWLVGGALVESLSGILLVRNQRRDGMTDWSPPGGVIDATDSSLLAGLSREVEEETGLRVTEWDGPLYRVEVVAPDMGWRMRVEVHRAVEFFGDLLIDDPDGIVDQADFFSPAQCHELLVSGAQWLHEPITQWLSDRWAAADSRHYHYAVRGNNRAELSVERVFD